MREIEIKARVKDPAKLKGTLKNLSVQLSEPLEQRDIVYSRPGAVDNDPDENWLRIRIQNGTKVFFTLKRSVTGELDSIEHEVEINNAEEMTSIVKYLGYDLFSDLVKTRQKGRFEDIEICYDELPKLGTFIEAELMCDEDADVTAVTARLWKLFESLGIDKADEETSGYDVLMKKLQTNS